MISSHRSGKIVPNLTTAIKQTNTKDLSTATMPELLEMKMRQTNLLSFKSKLDCLPDKGKRLKESYEKILKEIEKRSNVNDAAEMLSKLNLTNKERVKDLYDLEWKESNASVKEEVSSAWLESDEEGELDPLRVFADQTMTERHVVKLPPPPPEPSLISQRDLDEINSFKTENNLNDTLELEKNPLENTVTLNDGNTSNVSTLSALNKSTTSSSPSTSSTSLSHHPDEKHVNYIVEITENHPKPMNREKFKPFKTTKSNVHDPTKERTRKLGKHWEVTAATPPLIKHNGTQMLSLLDSVELQTNYLCKVKLLQEQQAAERLAAKQDRLGKYKILPLNEEQLKKQSFTMYRTKIEDIEGDRRLVDNLDEWHDLDEDAPGGHVNVQVSE